MTIPSNVIDMHAHVGVIGEGDWAAYGGFSEEYRSKLLFRAFLCLAGIHKNPLQQPHVTDQQMFDFTVQRICSAQMPLVVCLALDCYVDAMFHDEKKYISHVWVANEYITEKLQPRTNGKVLFGASVNPNRPRAEYETRVAKCVQDGAVLMKWLPSAMGINLADDHITERMAFLATAGKNGRPLPLLLHVGPEHAIPPAHGYEWMTTYDFLSWSKADDHRYKKFGSQMHRADAVKILANLETALHAGATLILAHCGLEYYSGEHSDFHVVRDLLQRSAQGEFVGKVYADVSSLCTPCRKRYFDDIRKLPAEHLLYGSDFPTPAFDISPDTLPEIIHDIEDIFGRGDLARILVPDGHPLDANYAEMIKFFEASHPLYTNFSKLVQIPPSNGTPY